MFQPALFGCCAGTLARFRSLQRTCGFSRIGCLCADMTSFFGQPCWWALARWRSRSGRCDYRSSLTGTSFPMTPVRDGAVWSRAAARRSEVVEKRSTLQSHRPIRCTCRTNDRRWFPPYRRVVLGIECRCDSSVANARRSTFRRRSPCRDKALAYNPDHCSS